MYHCKRYYNNILVYYDLIILCTRSCKIAKCVAVRQCSCGNTSMNMNAGSSSGNTAKLLYAVCYYKNGSRVARKTLSGLWDTEENALDDQLRVCGGAHKADVNGCVRGENGIVSWIIPVKTNTVIDWTLAVGGPRH